MADLTALTRAGARAMAEARTDAAQLEVARSLAKQLMLEVVARTMPAAMQPR